jgi:hypothetical protein
VRCHALTRVISCQSLSHSLCENLCPPISTTRTEGDRTEPLAGPSAPGAARAQPCGPQLPIRGQRRRSSSPGQFAHRPQVQPQPSFFQAVVAKGFFRLNRDNLREKYDHPDLCWESTYAALLRMHACDAVRIISQRSVRAWELMSAAD